MTIPTELKTPFPYFGGKSRIVKEVWARLGPVRTYIEPFAGSLAMLWESEPDYGGVPTREIVNDLSGFIVNTWRAIKLDPAKVAEILGNNCPRFELDLRARQRYLLGVEESLTEKILSDPEYYDAKIAAYWISGISAYVGKGFPKDDGGRPHTTGHGMGIYSLGNRDRIPDIFNALSQRLRHVKVLSGDWSRTVTDAVMELDYGPVGVFLDPPYTGDAGRTAGLYRHDDLDVGHDVFEWCLKYGDHPNIRIALCGLEGEYDIPDTWEVIAWEPYGNFKTTDRERIWFSPSCINPDQHVSGILGQFVEN